MTGVSERSQQSSNLKDEGYIVLANPAMPVEMKFIHQLKRHYVAFCCAPR
ncbi:hypothetical protein LGZ99_03170 [Photorhabdus temperata]|nr:hypothetical protein [Photorhabdus temperata]MCT8346234.1 hypothetical protein [Photorhabdus temperata]